MFTGLKFARNSEEASPILMSVAFLARRFGTTRRLGTSPSSSSIVDEAFELLTDSF
jgi:hypothetical protein